MIILLDSPSSALAVGNWNEPTHQGIPEEAATQSSHQSFLSYQQIIDPNSFEEIDTAPNKNYQVEPL
jgi:hypothetical protein